MPRLSPRLSLPIFALTALAFPLSARALTLSAAAIYTADPGYYVDSIATTADATPSRRVAVVLSDGDYADATVEFGAVDLLTGLLEPVAGYTRFESSSGDLIGPPLVVRDLVGDNVTDPEFIVAEASDPGSLLAGGSTGSPLWTGGTGASYPGFYNMSASDGGLRAGAGRELVFADANGMVWVADRATGAFRNSLDLFTEAGEYLSGAIAVAETTTSRNPDEIIAAGAVTGSVMVLSANGNNSNIATVNTIDLLWQSDPMPESGFVEGGGPAVADIDGDGRMEAVVVAADGITETNARVFAYELGDDPLDPTSCEYQWVVTGSTFYTTSPVIGNVLPSSASLEVVVESNDGIVSVLSVPASGTGCQTGTVSRTYDLGEDAFFTPALADIVGDNSSTLAEEGTGQDIIAAGLTGMRVINAEANVTTHTFAASGAYLIGTPLVFGGGTDANGRQQSVILLNSWFTAGINSPDPDSGEVYRIITRGTGNKNPDAPWTHYMGDRTRTGCVTGCGY